VYYYRDVMDHIIAPLVAQRLSPKNAASFALVSKTTRNAVDLTEIAAARLLRNELLRIQNRWLATENFADPLKRANDRRKGLERLWSELSVLPRAKHGTTPHTHAAVDHRFGPHMLLFRANIDLSDSNNEYFSTAEIYIKAPNRKPNRKQVRTFRYLLAFVPRRKYTRCGIVYFKNSVDGRMSWNSYFLYRDGKRTEPEVFFKAGYEQPKGGDDALPSSCAARLVRAASRIVEIAFRSAG
jgi:hypothetical protein